jgi:hypothetical protein
VLEDLVDHADVADVAYRSIEATGRFDSSAQWVTTDVRRFTLSSSVTDGTLAALIETARVRLDGVVAATLRVRHDRQGRDLEALALQGDSPSVGQVDVANGAGAITRSSIEDAE